MNPKIGNYKGLPDYKMVDVELKNKREMFAAIAMQGFASNPHYNSQTYEEMARQSVKQADALINALNK